mmetsp:Transcript_57263/g.165946  ORF Transcript_57263/g.165946 Transcript_57263/m.165946 type:complete len:221 (+) Transcript_57263:304-966(+)
MIAPPAAAITRRITVAACTLRYDGAAIPIDADALVELVNQIAMPIRLCKGFAHVVSLGDLSWDEASVARNRDARARNRSTTRLDLRPMRPLPLMLRNGISAVSEVVELLRGLFVCGAVSAAHNVFRPLTWHIPGITGDGHHRMPGAEDRFRSPQSLVVGYHRWRPLFLGASGHMIVDVRKGLAHCVGLRPFARNVARVTGHQLPRPRRCTWRQIKTARRR